MRYGAVDVRIETASDAVTDCYRAIQGREALNRIGTAEAWQIASLRRDDMRRNPVTIWVVRLDDDLYVRSANGRTSAWFRGTQERREGHIQAGGFEKAVTFVEEAALRRTTTIRSMPRTVPGTAATPQVSFAAS